MILNFCLARFDLQINWLVSIWWQLWRLVSKDSRWKQAGLQAKPAKNPKTHQWQKLIQLVSLVMLNCQVRNEIKRSSHSAKESNNLIGKENCGTKTQEPDCQIAWNNLTSLLFLWMPTHIPKNQHHRLTESWLILWFKEKQKIHLFMNSSTKI